jgi:uncharacterized membrane protein HdeD (DUF308 family)
MNDMSKTSKSIKTWGWLVLIAGILALLSPMVSGVTVAIMVGAMMMVAGVTRLIHAFQGAGFWSGLFGVISAVAGLIMMGRPLLGLATLTMVLVVYFLLYGASEVVAALQMRPAPGWGFLLFSGIVSLVLGYMIWSQWPISGVWAVGTLVGIQLIFSGMTMISIGSVIKNNAT